VVNDSADVTSSGRSFHGCGPATGKARLPTVDSLLVGMHVYQAIGVDRTQRSSTGCRSATRVKGPSTPAQVHGRLYVKTATS